VLNLVSDFKGETKVAGFWEHGAEENIWSRERKSKRRLKKAA
jgi:hypothetical protein